MPIYTVASTSGPTKQEYIIRGAGQITCSCNWLVTDCVYKLGIWYLHILSNISVIAKTNLVSQYPSDRESIKLQSIPRK